MKKQRFTYYLHDQNGRWGVREALESKGIELSEEAWEEVGQPFYEIALLCEVDEEGNVTILGLA